MGLHFTCSSGAADFAIEYLIRSEQNSGGSADLLRQKSSDCFRMAV